jgi:lipopolysaccharide exporter
MPIIFAETMTEPGPTTPTDGPPRGSTPSLPAPQKGTSGFIGSVLSVGGGAVLSQVLGILCLPIIARQFDPDVFGVFTVFGATTAIIAAAICLRYEAAILLPKEDKDAANVFILVCLVVCVISGLVVLAVALAGAALLDLVRASELLPYMWLLPANIFLTGISTALWYWSIRQKQFRRIAFRAVLTAVFTNGATMTGGYLGYRTSGYLVLVTVASSALMVLALGLPLLRHDLPYIIRSGSVSAMKQLAGRYRRFPLVDTWSVGLNVLSNNVTPLLLNPALGPTVVGLYGRARQLAAMPIEFVGGAVSQVFLQRTTAKRAEGEPLGPFVEEVQARLVAAATLPVLVTAVIGPEIMTVICGPQWTEAGLYARILVPWLFMVAITSPLQALITAMERLGTGLIFNSILTVARLGALVVGGWWLRDAQWTVILYTAVGTIGFGWLMIFLLRTAGARVRPLIMTILRHLLYSVPAVVTGIITKCLGLGPWWVVGAVAVASIPYGWLVIRYDKLLQSYVVEAMARLRPGRKCA